MNEFELSAILFYGDFLSLKNISKPLTESCKYFYIHGVPMNISLILNQKPIYDMDNMYFKQALEQYTILKNKYGEDGVLTFIDNICNLGVAGSVNAIQMLKYIHRYDDKDQRDTAFGIYKHNRKNKKYTHKVRNNDGDIVEEECSKYINHYENGTIQNI